MSLELGRIVITRVLTQDGDELITLDVSDDDLPVVVSLGMLRMAEDTLLHPAEAD